MMNERESKLYLGFFKRNLLVLLIPALLGIFLGVVYWRSIAETFSLTRQYQMNYWQENAGNIALLADEMVTEIRSSNIRLMLGVNPQVGLSVFKSGPLLLNLEIKSNQKDLLDDANKIDNYVLTKFPVIRLGNDVLVTKKPEVLLFALIGFSIGSLIGMLTSLIREYFRSY